MPQKPSSLPYQVKLCQTKVTKFLKSDRNFGQQSFTQQDNHNLSKCLVSPLGSLVLQLKVLLLLLDKIFLQQK